MPQRIHRNTLGAPATANVVGANSLTLALADPVSISATGFLGITASGSDRCHGYSLHSGVLASDNQTVGLVQPLYMPWFGMEVVYDTASSTASTASSRGTFVDLGTVTSGAITVTLADGTNSLTTTTRGQFHVLLNDPTGALNTEVVVEASEPQTFADGAAV